MSDLDAEVVALRSRVAAIELETERRILTRYLSALLPDALSILSLEGRSLESLHSLMQSLCGAAAKGKQLGDSMRDLLAVSLQGVWLDANAYPLPRRRPLLVRYYGSLALATTEDTACYLLLPDTLYSLEGMTAWYPDRHELECIKQGLDYTRVDTTYGEYTTLKGSKNSV